MEGWQRIPCLSANANGLEKGSSVEFTMPLILRILYGALYGDALMWLSLMNLKKEPQIRR